MAKQKPSKADIDKAIKAYGDQAQQAATPADAEKAERAARVMETIRDDLYPDKS